MKKKTEISIIIVNYNTKELLHACLASVFSAKKDTDEWEVIVLDNASSDGSVQMLKSDFPIVHVIEVPVNKGYAVANNLGIKKAVGKYILLLNSDTEVKSSTISHIHTFMDEHEDVGLATCKILLSDGTLDLACHRGFPTPWASITYLSGLERIFPESRVFSQYHLGYKGVGTLHEIDSPSGAFFFLRRSVIEQVGILDEQFFMYGEDIDWAYRIKRAGWKIMYVPSVSIIHHKKKSGRASTNNNLRKEIQYHFYSSMLIFYDKHFVSVYSYPVTALVRMIIHVRLLVLKYISV